jgi:hypothetical protein
MAKKAKILLIPGLILVLVLYSAGERAWAEQIKREVADEGGAIWLPTPHQRLSSSLGQSIHGVQNGPTQSLYTGFWNPWVVGMSQGQGFLCGDIDGDGAVFGGDVIILINYLFREGPPPNPLQAGDVNIDGKVNGSDVIYLLNYLFRDGPAPCEPSRAGTRPQPLKEIGG